MAPVEPRQGDFRSPVLIYFLATRPAFLSVTAVGAVLGWASAWHSRPAIEPLAALLTLFFALAAHAGANVLNDYHDHGNDARNDERLFPFTGGSRFIQNGILSPRATARFGAALLLLVIPAGLWLTSRSGSGLVWIGMAGLLIAWAYSAPPLRLASRGLGELGIVAAWWLVVMGSAFVQTGAFTSQAAAAGLGYGLMVANLLYVNQFPDASADARAGKLTLVARLGRKKARAGYVLIACAAFGGLLAAVSCGLLPVAALLASLAALPTASAARELWRHAEQPARLLPAIKQTILAAHLYGLLLALGLLL